MKKRFLHYLFSVVFLLFCGSINAQQTRADSLLQEIKAAKSDTARLDLLYSLAMEYIDNADYGKALLYTNQQQQLALRLETSSDKLISRAGEKGEAESWNHMGEINFAQSSMARSLNYYFIALRIYEKLGNKDAIAELYSNIASSYAGMGDYDQSLQYYFKSLKIDEGMNSPSDLATDYANIAAVLDDSKDKSGAMVYLVKAIALNKKLNNEGDMALCLNNLGGVYQFKADSSQDAGNETAAMVFYAKAEKYYSEALSLHEKYAHTAGIAIASENLGVVSLEQGKPELALTYLLKALDLYEKLNQKAETSYCLSNLGRVYQKLNKTAEAEKYYQRSLVLAKKTGSNDFLMRSNESLSLFYEEINRPVEALKYYKNYMAYHDSIFNQEETQKLVKTELNYDFEKRQAVNKAQHEKEIVVLEGQNKIQRQLRLFLFIVIGFCILVLFFVQRAYNNKKRLASFLASEDSRKELLLQEVHHRINNNLQIISSLLSLQANSAEDEKLTMYLKQSQNRIHSLSALHELLYQNNSSLQVNMPEYIGKVLDFHRDVAGTLRAKVSIDTDVTEVEFPPKIAVPLALIINELVTNSLKYAFAEKAEGKIEIILSGTDEKTSGWKLTVRDNGKGLGEISERRKGSLGLRLVNIMVKQIGAQMKVNEGPGASFEITFTVVQKKI